MTVASAFVQVIPCARHRVWISAEIPTETPQNPP